MVIEIRLFAGLNRFVQGAESGEPFSVTVPAVTTLAGLLAQLGIPEKEAYVTMVNGQASPVTVTLKEGDRVGIFPAVGGG